jgi:CP family cyanate transporter-like MFS transporter
VLLIALNLRAAIAGLSPLLPDVRADLGLSRAAAGLLTTLPLVCFAVLSPPAALLGRRIGIEMALMLAMVGLVAGSLLRTLLPGVGWMVVGTGVIGAAITVGNVLVPSAVKRDFADRQGLVTGLYTAALTAGAALASAVSAPLAHHAGLGWRGSLLAWAVLAALAGVVWLPQLRAHQSADRLPIGTGSSVWRSPVTWALAVFMGMQALAFYAMLAWLPALLQDAGVAAVGAGWALALFNLLGIASALVLPGLAGRRADQRSLALLVSGGWALGVAGLLAAPSLYLLWSPIAGLAQGAGISLALTLIVLRARHPAAARDLSGTVQSVGYLIGASGPLLLGALRDASGGWAVPLLALLGVIAVMAMASWPAAGNRQVG